MNDCEWEDYDDGAEAYIQEREMIRRRGKPFSTDVGTAKEYELYEQLFHKLFNGAAQLLTVYTGYQNTLEGQMGMVALNGDDGPTTAVTALHNVVAHRGSTPFALSCTFCGNRHNLSFQVEFQHLGLQKAKIQPLVITIGDTSINWEYGVDIAHGRFVENPSPVSTRDNFHVFKPVPKTYEYSIGTRIAMAIFAKQKATEESARINDMRTVDLEKVYGPPDEISIYSGTITGIGEQYFTHDMNSYRGCSGAITFLLEGEDAGKCIGVHVGSPPEIEPPVNLSIKIHGWPTLVSRPERENTL